MTNKNYLKGVRFERKIMNNARNEGLLSFRTAGSHSPIDVVIINEKFKRIELIQCKHTKCNNKKLKSKFERSNIYRVDWIVMEK